MAGIHHQETREQRGVDLDHEQFCCSVCLDLLKEPVTIHCGHSYCRSCIESCWDEEEEEKGECSCPQCRETFHPRPVLRRNNLLLEVVKKLKGRSPKPPPAPLTAVDPADVPCDFCGPRRSKATKSCLTCLASYCDEHVEPHYSVPVLQKHELVSAGVPLVEKMCKRHSKLMELYCWTDEQLMCTECTADEHKGHRFQSVSEQKDVTKKRLVSVQRKIQEKARRREEELENILQAERNVKDCARASLNDCQQIFSQLIASVQRRSAEVEQMIRAQEQTAACQAEELREQLEAELSKLRRRGAQVQRLLNAGDSIYLMQSLPTSEDSEDFRVSAGPPRSFGDVTGLVSQLREKIDTLLKETWLKISTTVSYVHFSLPPPGDTRQEFLRYWRPLHLDDTSNFPNLHLLSDNRRMRPSAFQAPPHPDRFTKFPQVLCREALTGRRYWEVEWHANALSAAVAYKGADRTSDKSEFGRNDESWTLESSEDGLSFLHNDVETKVPGSRSDRIGVFLDHEAGVLSFYRVSEPMVRIFEVRTAFTEPLHPGIGLRYEWYNVGVFAELNTLQ